MQITIPEDRMIELVDESAPLRRVRPRLSLEPGEYAFVSQSSLNVLFPVRMFDFGID